MEFICVEHTKIIHVTLIIDDCSAQSEWLKQDDVTAKSNTIKSLINSSFFTLIYSPIHAA